MKKLLIFLSCFALLVLILPPSPSVGQEFTGYADVRAQMWSYNFIYKAQSEGFFDAASLFRPTEMVNRAQLAKFVYKIAEQKGLLQSGVDSGASSFADVSKDHWASLYIRTVASLGFMTGYTDEEGQSSGAFGPDDPVTRAQVAKVLSLSSGISLPVDARYIPSFPDVSEGEWFFEPVRRVTFHCVMTGYENGFFGPKDPLTKEQVAKVIVKTLTPGCGEGQNQLEYSNSKYLYSLKYPLDYVVYSGLDVGAETFFPASKTSKKVTVTKNTKSPFCCDPLTLAITAVETTQSAHEWLRENLAKYDFSLNFNAIASLSFQRKTAAEFQGEGSLSSALRVLVIEDKDQNGKPFLLVVALGSADPVLESVLSSLTIQ